MVREWYGRLERVMTAFSPKKRCPFQFVPVIALAT